MSKPISIVLALFFQFVVACAVTPLVPEEQGPQSPALAVASFNIRYGTASDGENHWEKRKANVVATIRSADPGLLGIQEALGFQVDYLKAELSNYQVVGVGRGGSDKGEYSCLMIDTERFQVLRSDTFWLSDEPEQVGSKGWDAALPRICTWAVLLDKTNGREFLWMNSHFDHRGKLARERSAALIHSRMQTIADLPTIITGDFNAGEDSAALKSLKGDTMLDSYRVLYPGDTLVGTFNGFQGSSDGSKIDYILVSPHWRVLSASIDRRVFEGRTPSDHYPVRAELKL
ncbi:MAG: endonuclease/exonuclease/phosphatase family metal-dependent hydrolase [Planctomycetota bacterium]|jgi:endonuclease/exonuclease/phosphatase family metal-dependent hydrolase